MKIAAAVLISALATSAFAAPPIKVADLAWMTGAWIQAGPDRTVRETWLPAAGDQMIGLGQTHRPGRRATYEFTRIEERNGVIAFTAIL
ncbi:MAG TPA: DUF6265 family protein, partial [Caulobacteraceae bacterium]|nr:DUF6265 family protein [Caulobacteraceae bacterium]